MFEFECMFTQQKPPSTKTTFRPTLDLLYAQQIKVTFGVTQAMKILLGEI